MSAEGQAVITENGYIGSDDAAAFESNGATGKVTVSGSSSVTPVMEKLKEAYTAANSGAEIEIQESDSTTGMTDAAAALLLGIMILPTIISVSESSIRAVEESYYEGALALGATHERSVFTVVVPAAKSGVFAAVVLGVGRALGETMAVMMVVGNQARVPDSIFKGVRTLTTNIVLEMGYATDLHREALIATGVVLFVFILIINISFSILKRGGKE
jgi:phosphate transport system permease protein